MQRVFVVLSLVVAAFVCGASRASAITELCPAYASPLNALDAVGDAKTATLFSYELDALSASTVSGTLAVQTDKGWFAAPFGPVAMTPHPETFNFTGLIFTRKSVFSAPLYLRFGMPVTVVRAFVTTASTDDTAFSWPAHGPVACDDAGAPMQFAPTHPDPVRFDPSTGRKVFIDQPEFPVHAELAALPAPQDIVTVPKPAPGYAVPTCPMPFASPRVVTSNPFSYQVPQTSPPTFFLSTWIVVALDAQGAILDSWTYAPSMQPRFDQTALDAAHGSTFSPATSRCRNVPSLYIFNVNVTNLPIPRGA